MSKSQKRTNKKKNNLHSTTRANQLFDFVVDSLQKESGVSTANMFGAIGLRHGTKFFAMLYKRKLVVKLPADRVEELVKSKTAKRFDPGQKVLPHIQANGFIRKPISLKKLKELIDEIVPAVR